MSEPTGRTPGTSRPLLDKHPEPTQAHTRPGPPSSMEVRGNWSNPNSVQPVRLGLEPWGEYPHRPWGPQGQSGSQRQCGEQSPQEASSAHAALCTCHALLLAAVGFAAWPPTRGWQCPQSPGWQWDLWPGPPLGAGGAHGAPSGRATCPVLLWLHHMAQCTKAAHMFWAGGGSHCWHSAGLTLASASSWGGIGWTRDARAPHQRQDTVHAVCWASC